MFTNAPNPYNTLGAAGKKTAFWTGLLTGAVAGYAIPQVVTFLKAKGVSDADAQKIASNLAAGTQKLSPELEAEMKRTIPPPPPGSFGFTNMPSWVLPVGVGAVVIGGMFMMMPRGGGIRRARR
jgi:hypothetical protein